MRQTRPWLHILAVVALMVGVLPVSALAALCQPTSCVKNCCTVNAPEPVQAQSCHTAQAQNKADKNLAAKSARPSGCKCTLTSKTTQQAEQVVPAMLGYKVPELAVAVLPVPVDISLPVEVLVLPGVFASDSGPPESIASLPWLGRAPPVRLA